MAKTFTQHIDHFNYQDDRTFEQRYWINIEYFKDNTNGPNFIYICGEWVCGVGDSFAWMVAAQNGARMVTLEHRFYGES